MKLRMDQMIRSFATGLDAVESDFLGASTNHGQRIATLCAAMGRHLGMTEDELETVAFCALLHDNALTEYILSERPGSAQEFNRVSHCIYGQNNAENLPFLTPIDGLILYHHECADGSGPFGKKEGEYPLGAALIAIADMIDSRLHLQRWEAKDLPQLRRIIADDIGTMFTADAAAAMLEILDEEMLASLKDDRIYFTFDAAMPEWEADLDGGDLIRMSVFVARIIDYKSEFTKKHSIQVANMAWQMADHYGLDADTKAKIYFAGALHDLGKLFVPTEILEKPGALTEDEFDIIKGHIGWTSEMLSKVAGLGEICKWASNHHEKLDGTGYPGNLSAERLDFISRMMTCIDIYQAVSDARPYHPARSHDDTMAIMRDMVYREQLDGKIVSDLSRVMRRYPAGEVPPPKPDEVVVELHSQ